MDTRDCNKLTISNARSDGVVEGGKLHRLTGPTTHWTLLSCLMVLLIVATSASGLDNPELLKRANPSVVSVYGFDSLFEPVSQGSGFFVDSCRVVSCWHVVEEADILMIECDDDSLYAIDSVVAIDFEGDLVEMWACVLSKPQGLPLAGTVPSQGDEVLVVGSPLGFPGSVSDGIVAAVRDADELGPILQITAPISSGSSGSPVISRSGEVVGIVGATIEEGQNLNFAVSSGRIRDIQANWESQLATYLEPQETIDYDSLYALADQLTDNEQYNQADGLWSLLIDTLGDGPYVTFRRGMCRLASGKFNRALRDFRVSNEFQKSHEAFYNIYLAEIGLEDTLGATAALEKALEMQPDDSASVLALATLYEARGSYGSAMSLLRGYVKKRPDNVAASKLLCYALFMLERYDEAVACYENLLEADPDGGSAWSYLGWCYTSSEKYRKAISCFEKAKTMETADYTDQWGLAEAYLGIGDTTKGLQNYKLALRAGPQEAVLYNDYAVLLQALGKVFSALDNYQKAAELDPAEWLYQWNLGNLYMALGRKTEANEALDKARLLKEKSQETD